MNRFFLFLLFIFYSENAFCFPKISEYVVNTSGAYKTNHVNSTGPSCLLTYNGNQYIAYWNNSGKMVLGKRQTSGTFTEYVYDGTSGRANISVTADAHNYIALGVDKDGYIHISYNMHNVSLKYRVSSSPEDISSLGSEISMLGTNENSATYPCFFNSNSGDLYFMFRNGSSGAGNTYLYKYSESTDSWSAAQGTSTAGLLFDGLNSTGIYNAYPSEPVVDSKNVAHIAFMWRDTPSQDDNKNLSYVKYNLNSGVFYRSDDSLQTMPILTTNSETVDPINFDSGFIIGTPRHSIDVDINDNPTITYTKLDGNGDSQIYLAQFKNSVWTIYGPISNNPVGTGNLWLQGEDDNLATAPSHIIFDESNTCYVIYRQTGLYQGIFVYKSTNLTSWETEVIYFRTLGTHRITFDYKYWKQSNVLNLLITRIVGSDNSGISILEYIPSGGIYIEDIDLSGVTL